MAETQILQELMKATGIHRTAADGDDVTFFIKLCEAVDDLADDEYKKLPKKAREWFEGAGGQAYEKRELALPKGETLPVLNGVDTTAEAAEAKEAEAAPAAAEATEGAKPEEKDETKEDKVAGKKKAKAAPAAKKATAKDANGAKKFGTYGGAAKITVVAKENPKREGTSAHKRFAKYKTGMTVADAVDAGIKVADLRSDASHEYIKISD